MRRTSQTSPRKSNSNHRMRSRLNKRNEFKKGLHLERLEERALMAVLDTFMTNEHVDLNFTYNPGSDSWEIRPTDDDTGTSYSSENALIYAGDAGTLAQSRPADAAFSFIGVASGATYYRLPATQDPNLVFLGIAGYGVGAAQLDRYSPATESKGRASGSARWIKASLSQVVHTLPDGSSGNGIFSMWQSGDTGPTSYVSNFNDGISNPDGSGLDSTDGISADDAVWVVSGGHSHYNYGFSQPGRYEVSLVLSSYFGDDGNNSSPNLAGFKQSTPIKVYFSVFNVGEVQFVTSAASVNEDAGTASITVQRVGGSDGQIQVNYATVQDSATAGSDYTTTAGTLVFQDKETSKVITVPLLNDNDDEPDESFRLVLSSPAPSSIQDYLVTTEGDSNGLLGTTVTTTITILDDDLPPSPPTISDVVDQVTDEDIATGNIPFVIGDNQTAATALVVTASSSNTTLFPTGSIVLGGTAENRTIRLTPASNASGTAVITLTVRDQSNLTASDVFTVTVNSVNDLPTLTDISDQFVAEDTPTSPIPFTIGDVETSAANLAVSATSSNTALLPLANIQLAGTGASRTIRLTPAANAFGTSTVTITVTDENLGSIQKSFLFTVDEDNDPPTISSIDDVVMNEDGDVTIFFTINDTESAASALVVSGTRSNSLLFPTLGTNLDSTILLEGTGTNRSVRLRPAADVAGTSTITLTVTDESGAAAQEFFSVQVNGVYDPPIVAADNLLAIPNRTSTFDLLVNDVPGAEPNQTFSLTSFTQPSFGMVTFGPNGSVRYQPNAGYRGADQFTYTITDNNSVPVTGIAYVTVAENMVVDGVHADLSLSIVDGKWFMENHAELSFGTPEAGDENPTRLDWDESILFANPSSLFTLPANLDPVQFNFLGRAPGESLYRLPENHDPNLVFPGISTEDLPAGTLVSYTPSGDPRAATAGEWIAIELVGFDIPSGTAFSLYRTGDTGPVVFWDSLDGINTANESGIGGNVSDTFWTQPETHAHSTWTFTHPGRYMLDVRVRAFVNQGGNTVEIVSPINTLHFDVESISPLLMKEADPVAISDTAIAIRGGSPVTIAVLDNDNSSPDLIEQLAILSVGAASGGSVSISPSGNAIVYTPSIGFVGTDSFSYQLVDEHGGVATGNVQVQVLSTQPTLAVFDRPRVVAIDPSNNFLDFGPDGVQLADLNGDSRKDVIYTEYNRGVSVSYNLGGGNFAPRFQLPTFVSSDFILADIDGDNDLDIAVIAYTETIDFSEQAIVWFENLGGTFSITAAVIAATAREPGSYFDFRFGDLDADGRNDLVYSDSSGKLGWFRNLGSGVFAAEQVIISDAAVHSSLALADIDGDNDLDIVSASGSPTGLHVLRNNGNSTPGFNRELITTLSGLVNNVTIADMDVDGFLDILVVSGPSGNQKIGLYRGSAGGTFGSEIVVASGLDDRRYVVGDVDGNLLPDLVLSSPDSGKFFLVQNLAANQYGPKQEIAGDDNSSSAYSTIAAIGDLDGDGRADIASAELFANRVVWRRNRQTEIITQVASPEDGTYVRGYPLEFDVFLGFNVQIDTTSGSPTLPVNIGGQIVQVPFAGQPDPSTLRFRHIVQESDIDSDGIAIGNAVALNGAVVTDVYSRLVANSYFQLPAVNTSGILVNGNAPTVVQVTRLDANPATTNTVRFAVSFSEPVTGVDLSDFALITQGVTGSQLVGFSGSGSSYIVEVRPGSGDGFVRLEVLDNDTIRDLNSHALGGIGLGNGGFLFGQGYDVRSSTALPRIDVIAESGHLDLVLTNINGGWDVNWLEFNYTAPKDLLLYADQPARRERPVGNQWNFLGANAGETIWVYPETFSPTIPGPGLGAYDNIPGNFASYFEADSRVSAAAPWLKMQLLDVRGPQDGIFALYQSGDIAPKVWMSSVDGIDAQDSTWLPELDHVHYNWAFSKPGVYQIDVAASGFVDRNGNGTFDEGIDAFSESQIVTLYFAVETPNSTPVNHVPSTAFARKNTRLFFAGNTAVSVSDVDEHPAGIQVEISTLSGSISLGTTNGLTFLEGDGTNDTEIKVRGLLSDINAALTTLSFLPTTDFTGVASMGIFTNDLGRFAPDSNQDGEANNSRARFDIFEFPVSAAPVAVDDNFALLLGRTVHGNLLVNDIDENLIRTSAQMETLPSFGSVTLTSDGSFTYTPSPNFNGSDQFSYRVFDEFGFSDSATVLIGEVVLPTFVTTLTNEHVDVGVAYDAGAFDMHIHDETNDIEYAPNEALFSINSAALATRPLSSEFDFIGVGPGARYYRLSETLNPSSLFLGLGTEEIADGTFLAGRVLLKLESVSGPGDFSMWTSGDFGPEVRFSTDLGIYHGDGIELIEGGHKHVNWAFTERGTYAIQFRALGTLADGTDIIGEPATYFFHVNTEPVALADSYQTRFGDTLFGNVLFNDEDPDGDSITSTLLTSPQHGTISFSANGAFKYTPNATFDGLDSFSYTLTDAFGDKSIGMVTIEGATAPTFVETLSTEHVDVGFAFEAGEWEPHIHDETNDQEYEPDQALLAVSQSALTTRPISSAFNFIGVNGGETYYRLSSTANPATLFLGLGTEEIAAGTFTNGELKVQLKNVSGPGDFSLWFSTDAGPQVLMATSNGITEFDFARLLEAGHTHANWGFTKVGEYAVTFEASGMLANGELTSSGDVTYYFRVNQSPNAVGETIKVNRGSTYYGNVLFNDTDPENDALSASLLVSPANGTVVLNSNGSFSYTPSITFLGSDSFSYTVTDAIGDSVTATVTIGLTSIPSFTAQLSEGHVDVGIAYEEGAWEPHVHDEESDTEYAPNEVVLTLDVDARVTRPTSAPFNFIGVGAGERYFRLSQSEVPSTLFLGIGTEEIAAGTFLNGQINLKLKSMNGPGHFSLWQTTDAGPVVYMATADGVLTTEKVSLQEASHGHFNWGFTARGLYQVTFEAMATLPDGSETSSGDVTYYFRVENPPPIALDDQYVVTGRNSIRSNLLFNDFDPEQEIIVATLASPPLRGTVTIDLNGRFTYTPNAPLTTSDSFTYTITNERGLVDTATVIISPAPGTQFNQLISSGAVDVEVTLNGPSPSVTLEKEPTGELVSRNAGLIGIPQAVLTARPTDNSLAFVGVPAGGTFYRLSEFGILDPITLGMGAERISLGAFSSNQVHLRLKAVNGPGHVSAWRTSNNGAQVLWATSDGITTADVTTMVAGTDDRLNWAFTAAGFYHVTVEATAINSFGGTVSSGEVSLYFYAGHRREDVNIDGDVSPMDALLIINRLNLDNSIEIKTGETRYDLNFDSLLSPLDALLVINFLNNQSGFESEGEGESAEELFEPAAISSSPTSQGEVFDMAMMDLFESDSLFDSVTKRRRR